MTSEELKAALADLPAGPFTIHLKGRTPLEAMHTDYGTLSPGGSILNVYDAAKMHWLEVASVTRISCNRPVENAAS